LGATFDLHAKPIEVDVLTLDHADYHPAQGLQMTRITPLIVTLTQIIIQRIIESGSWSHRFH